MNNILPTGTNLMRWKKADNAFCIYCNINNHSTKHLLWDCKHLQQLWELIETSLDVELTYQSIILGIPDKKNANTILSLLCFLIYKKYLGDRQNTHKMDIYAFISKELSIRLGIYNSNVCSLRCRTLVQNILQLLVNM